MDKQIITFSANEQHLHKTGGLDIYASKTVSYIEAHFDLGDNWSGYDSIEAVWWNDYVRPVRTVLDTEGVCVVPPEVLMRKSVVYVNLVGVIASGNTLTDRLTTHPITALTNKFNAQLGEGTTTPLTPSEYEQFVASVKADADRAEDAKDSARVYAGNALSSAQNALASETNASTSETNAHTSEVNARASELNAETYKDQAQTYAQNADNSAISAENAKDEAEDARDTMLGMRAEATTLPEGSSATASYNDGVMSFGIPKGDTGATGATGETGATPQLSIGTVETTTEPSVTITGTAENPVLNFGLVKGDKGDTGEVSLADLSTLLPTDTASGAIASFPDGQSVIPALSVKAEIEPIQDLHGYDKPWAAGAGANLLNSDYAIKFTLSKTITLPQTILNGTKVYIHSDAFSYTTPPSSGNKYPYYVFRGANNENRGQIWGFSDSSVTLSGDAVAIELWSNGYDYGASSGVEVTISGLTISKTEQTTWTPYSNICPISGRTEVVTWDDPKYGGTVAWNQLAKFGTNANNYNIVSDYEIKAKTDLATVTYPSFSHVWNGTHKCLVRIKNSTSTNLSFYTDTAYTQSYGVRSNTESEKILSITSAMVENNNPFLAVGAGVLAQESIKANIFDLTQMFGSTIADYIYSLEQANAGAGVAWFRKLFPKPYYAYNAGETTCVSAVNGDPYNHYTTSLGRTVYGGTLDVVSGVLTVTHGIVDLGTLAWGTGFGGFWSSSLQNVIQPPTDYSVPTAICSAYPWSLTETDCFYIQNAQNYKGWIIVKDSRYTDATAFKSAVSGVQLCYELATPQTIQLTPQEVALLKGQNNLWCDSGNIQVNYYADIQSYIDKKLS